MLKENNRLWDFKIMQEIGRGETGIVYRVINRKTNMIQALKKIPIGNMTDAQKRQTYRQLKLLQKLNHPNVIPYHQSFISAQNLYIVMDYANKGDLLQTFSQRRLNFNNFKQSQLWDIFKQLAEGLNYLHEQKIMHRDIKLQNIFVHEDKGHNSNQDKRKQYLIGDLGLSRLIHQKSIMQSKRVGTPIYFAPQMIQHQPYSFPVDLWALGCVFYSLTNLKHPFQHAILENLAYVILTKPLKPIKSFYSQKVCTVIQRLLQKVTQKRINTKQLIKLIGEKPIQSQTVKIFSLKYYSDLKKDAIEQKHKIRQKLQSRQSSSRKNKMASINYEYDSILDPESSRVNPMTDMKQLLKTVKCMRPSSLKSSRKVQSQKKQLQFDPFVSFLERTNVKNKVLSKSKNFDYISRPLSATYKNRFKINDNIIA